MGWSHNACKLRLELNSLPDINEPLAPKAKWRHHKTHQRLRSPVQALEAKAKQTPFRKSVNTRSSPTTSHRSEGLTIGLKPSYRR